MYKKKKTKTGEAKVAASIRLKDGSSVGVGKKGLKKYKKDKKKAKKEAEMEAKYRKKFEAELKAKEQSKKPKPILKQQVNFNPLQQQQQNNPYDSYFSF